jgi:hypothetical protein
MWLNGHRDALQKFNAVWQIAVLNITSFCFIILFLFRKYNLFVVLLSNEVWWLYIILGGGGCASWGMKDIVKVRKSYFCIYCISIIRYVKIKGKCLFLSEPCFWQSALPSYFSRFEYPWCLGLLLLPFHLPLCLDLSQSKLRVSETLHNILPWVWLFPNISAATCIRSRSGIQGKKGGGDWQAVLEVWTVLPVPTVLDILWVQLLAWATVSKDKCFLLVSYEIITPPTHSSMLWVCIQLVA